MLTTVVWKTEKVEIGPKVLLVVFAAIPTVAGGAGAATPGLVLDKVTTTANGGALSRVTVPLALLPPMTDVGWTAIAAIRGCTRIVSDWGANPGNEAVIVARPSGPGAFTVREPEDLPASIVSVPSTLATAGLLLASETVTGNGTDWVSVTVPPSGLPRTVAAASSVSDVRFGNTPRVTARLKPRVPVIVACPGACVVTVK